jgi:hypothetical protein
MAENRQAKQPANGDGRRPVLRRIDQAAVAALVALSLVGMGVYWVVQGGPRGELIQIDRADPLTARYLVDISTRRNGRSSPSCRILGRRSRSGSSIHGRRRVRFAIMTTCAGYAGLGRGRWRR